MTVTTDGPRRKHHVFLFRHCVRSTNKRQRLHNNWTAFVQNTEQDYQPQDFIEEGYSNWNTPQYWCTQTGLDIMEGSGRFLFDQLAKNLVEDRLAAEFQNTDEEYYEYSMDFQVIVDESSQRDVDTALALIKGLRQQRHNTEANPHNIRLKGLDQLTFASSWLFQPFRQDEGMCENKLSTNKDGYRERIRNQIQHRLDTVPPPEPGLAYTLSKIERRGGSGALGSIQDVPTWIQGSGEELLGAPFINTSSPFPIVVSDENAYLAGPINLVKWFAEMLFFTRAGGVEVPFLWNATLPELYKFVEWIHWERTIVAMENSIAASQGSIMSRAILDALLHGHVNVANPPTRTRTTVDPSSTASTMPCSKNDDDEHVSSTKVTLIVGHDGDLDSVATALGLRWRLGPRYHTSPANQQGEYVPTPPGSAMHFELDLQSKVVEQSFWYPVLVEHFEPNSTYRRIPKGMRRNSTGILEQVPLVVKPRSTKIQEPSLLSMQLSKDGKRMVLPHSGIDLLEAQLNATLALFPDAVDCYKTFISRTHQELYTGTNGKTACPMNGIHLSSNHVSAGDHWQARLALVGLALAAAGLWRLVVGWRLSTGRRKLVLQRHGLVVSYNKVSGSKADEGKELELSFP
jgi:hypothetical protein